MDSNKEKILYKDLSYKIVGLAMEVHRKLGYGFLEKVYENAMMLLLRQQKIEAPRSLLRGISVCKVKSIVFAR
ncbi:MAG: GxxExxY protein [Thermodesulfobacteriota bacterium]